MKRIWYVLHVKPRTEKKAAGYLKHYRIWHHLPLYRKTTRVQRRKVVREIPIFPGYVFVRMNPVERLEMLKTNLIVRTIDVPFPRTMIHQLRQIARAGRSGQEVRKVEKFTLGDLVRITQGPFYGIEGYVKKDEGKTMIVLNVEILGQAVALSILPSWCEKIEK
jgi:transcription antitermination factor NusG